MTPRPRIAVSSLSRLSVQYRENMAIWLSFSLTLLSFSLVSGQYQPNWNSLDSRPLPKWYDQVKFGIELHWGVFSVPSYGGGPAKNIGSEWFWEYWRGYKAPWAVDFMERNHKPGYTYPDFAHSFNAELFDPDAWVEIFKAAGAKYVILTSKHHEGWTNWRSNVSWNWNSVKNGPHMDLVARLANATRAKSSIHFGLYFSQYEWFHPLYLQDKATGYKTQTYIKEVTQPQMHEIVNAYKPEVIWSDGDWEANSTYWNSTGFIAWLYNDSPVKDTVVVNDRWGADCRGRHGDYFTFHDRYQPGVLVKHKWESIMTMDKYSGGFRRDARLSSYLSISQLINDLVITVSCGGNLLLNVGITHGGRIMPVFEERLRQIGSWLSVNGEAIYNTTYWTYQDDTVNSDVWYTYNNETKVVYGTLLKWPDSYSITLGAVKTNSTSKISLLGYSGNIAWESEGPINVIVLPLLPLGGSLQWAWTFKFVGVTAN